MTSIVAVGQPLGEFYMYKFAGVDPADRRRDLPATRTATATSRPPIGRYVGNPQPKYFGGFTNTFTLGAFDLRGVPQFSQGNEVFNMMRIFTDDGGCTYDNKSDDDARAGGRSRATSPTSRA